MKITIFGGTGYVGTSLIKAALAAGHEVSALVRSPEKLGDLATQIRVIEGQYFCINDQLKALEGADAVLTTIGPPLKRNCNLTKDQYVDTMVNLISGMKTQGVSRIVSIAGAGTSLPSENIVFTRKLFRFLLKTLAPLATPVKEAELALLRESGLNYTVVRPNAILENVKGSFHANKTSYEGIKVNLEQLSEFMVDILNEEEWFQTQPFVSTF